MLCALAIHLNFYLMDCNMSFKHFFLSTGDKSIMRLGFFIVVVTGCSLATFLSVYDMIKNNGANLTNVTILVSSILGVAFGGKVLQSKDELKSESNLEQK